jgi:hypothetical protein
VYGLFIERRIYKYEKIKKIKKSFKKSLNFFHWIRLRREHIADEPGIRPQIDTLIILDRQVDLVIVQQLIFKNLFL